MEYHSVFAPCSLYFTTYSPTLRLHSNYTHSMQIFVPFTQNIAHNCYYQCYNNQLLICLGLLKFFTSIHIDGDTTIVLLCWLSLLLFEFSLDESPSLFVIMQIICLHLHKMQIGNDNKEPWQQTGASSVNLKRYTLHFTLKSQVSHHVLERIFEKLILFGSSNRRQ